MLEARLDFASIFGFAGALILKEDGRGLAVPIVASYHRQNGDIKAGKVTLKSARHVQRDLQPRLLALVVMRQQEYILHHCLLTRWVGWGVRADAKCRHW